MHGPPRNRFMYLSMFVNFRSARGHTVPAPLRLRAGFFSAFIFYRRTARPCTVRFRSSRETESPGPGDTGRPAAQFNTDRPRNGRPSEKLISSISHVLPPGSRNAQARLLRGRKRAEHAVTFLAARIAPRGQHGAIALRFCHPISVDTGEAARLITVAYQLHALYASLLECSLSRRAG